MNDIDVTVLENHLPNTRWKCPHCGEFNVMGQDGPGMLVEYGKYIENCDYCNALHFWKLKLTNDFKQKIADSLKKGEMPG